MQDKRTLPAGWVVSETFTAELLHEYLTLYACNMKVYVTYSWNPATVYSFIGPSYASFLVPDPSLLCQ